MSQLNHEHAPLHYCTNLYNKLVCVESRSRKLHLFFEETKLMEMVAYCPHCGYNPTEKLHHDVMKLSMSEIAGDLNTPDYYSALKPNVSKNITTDFVGTREAASFLGVEPSFLYKMIYNNQLKAFKLNGGRENSYSMLELTALKDSLNQMKVLNNGASNMAD